MSLKWISKMAQDLNSNYSYLVAAINLFKLPKEKGVKNKWKRNIQRT
jgi:hypothetical protein